MTRPELNALYAKLAVLHGTWEGGEQLAPSPWMPGGKAHGRMTFRPAADGKIVVQDYEQTGNGRATFQLHGVFTLDPENGEVLWYGFDSFGFPPPDPARGGWSGDTLTLVKRTPRGAARHTLALGGDQLTYRIENQPPEGSDWHEFLSGEYARQPE